MKNYRKVVTFRPMTSKIRSPVKPQTSPFTRFMQRLNMNLVAVMIVLKLAKSLGLYDPISKENMLLRGSRLKNTDFVEAIVIYAGKFLAIALKKLGIQVMKQKSC